MCEILSVFQIDNCFVLGCSEYDGDFTNSKILKIQNKTEGIISINNYIVEKPRECFDKYNTPWIIIKEEIPKEFIKKGNNVYFL